MGSEMCIRDREKSSPHESPTSRSKSVTLDDVRQVTLPSPAWAITSPSPTDHVIIMKTQEQSSIAQPLVISHTVAVNSDFTWTLTVHGHEVTKDQCSAIRDIPEIIGIYDLSQLLLQLDQLTVCPGHPDQHFESMANARKGSFTSSSGDTMVYVDRNVAVRLNGQTYSCLLYTSPSPRDATLSRMPSSA